MKFCVISNSLMGVQGIQFLMNQQKLAGVAIPDRFNEANEMVKMICNQYSIPLQVVGKDSKSDDLRNWLQATQSDAVIAAGCPFKIERENLAIPGKGFWNIHAGKLPEYSGPDPVFWQIRNREKTMVVTIHKMTEKIDCGPVLLEQEIEIAEGKTYGQIWQQLQHASTSIFQKIAAQLESDIYQVKEQTASDLTYTKRPVQKDMIIDWTKMKSDEVIALVNACNPNYGGAFGLYRGGFIRILRLKKIKEKTEAQPGEIIKADSEDLWVQAKDNQALSIEIAHMADGYLTGADLVMMDIRVGDHFNNPG